jgi:hypothetical protein
MREITMCYFGFFGLSFWKDGLRDGRKENTDYGNSAAAAAAGYHDIALLCGGRENLRSGSWSRG